MAIKILSVFGTRPEAIKMAPVVLELQRRSSEFESLICVTAQHREMLDQIMHSFDLRADFDLNVMTQAQTPAEVAARVLELLPPVLRAVKPDMVLVQGRSTNSISASAIGSPLSCRALKPNTCNSGCCSSNLAHSATYSVLKKSPSTCNLTAKPSGCSAARS